MRTKKLLLSLLLPAGLCWGTLKAQVKIGDNPNSIQQSSLLELESQQKGILIPRMNSTQRDDISNAAGFDPQNANSLLIFNSDLDQFQYWNTVANSWLTIEDAQTLTLNNGVLSISGGNAITLPAGSDNQNLNLAGNTLSIQNANSVDLSPYLDNTDAQTITLSGNTLTVSNGGSIDLTPYLDNTDNQTLSVSGADLTIAGGNTVTLPQGTDNQTIALSGNTLSIQNANSVDLTPYLDNTDNQTVTLTGNTLAISNGNSIDLSPYLDNTDAQTITLSGNTLTVSNGGSIDLTPYLDNTDNQTLALSGSSLSIAGGNSVNIAGVNTDNQTLSLSGSNLSITGGNSVTLPTAWGLNGNTGTNASNYLGTADNRSFQIGTNATPRIYVAPNSYFTAIGPNRTETWSTVEVSSNTANGFAGIVVNANGGGSSQAGYSFYTNTAAQDASIFLDEGDQNKLKFALGTGIHTASGRSATTRMVLTQTGDLGLGTSTPTARLDVNGQIRMRTGAAAGRVLTSDATGLASWQTPTDNDNQTLSLSGDVLTIAGGNSINISGADNQTLSVSGSTLSIAGGNSVTLPTATSVWTTVSTNTHYEISAFAKDAEIKYGTGDLNNSSFSGANGVFWGTDPGEDTGMFTDGDRLVLMSPGDSRLIQFWEEDGHVQVAYIEQNGQYFQTSDRNLKHNIQTLAGTGLQALSKLNGYRYTYKQCEEDIKKGTPANTTLGIMAQELKEVAPELVQQSDQGHYLVNYDGIIPILIEVNKEQQLIIDEQAATIEAQSKKLSDLEARMQRLEQLLNDKK
ncbi:tail fiber domain-containing protein [Saprospira grandis]|uniref:tail fiber domain-containing protein n=1 Tax=Saprospira grandis TaxID=1008 RepID=UPI0022DD052D|nr:tail fiber domain-containing protein [Saprospira grandis]WBM76211.1 tail fiber domain-containing protein [Saprospira grandis]